MRGDTRHSVIKLASSDAAVSNVAFNVIYGSCLSSLTYGKWPFPYVTVRADERVPNCLKY